MTDRELLAKAAAAYFVDAPKHIGIGVLDWVRDCIGEWNPLTDDGDALRLAVKLRIDIEHMQQMHGQPCGVSCHPKGRGDCQVDERNDSDPYAATRRAIVRAAAEIGKEMP